ncbi:MAG: amidohydrolase family protein, partial [Planctomycetota bacterium]|nr:amidohydrolase family protein [Planctomycetota bacterium]
NSEARTGAVAREAAALGHELIKAASGSGLELLGPAPAPLASLDTLLRLMEQKSIEKAFTLSARGAFYDFLEGNRETLAACREHPQLLPVGTVNPARWLGCLDEAKRLIGEGVKLLRFFPQYQEWHITEAPFRKLLDDVLAGSGVGLTIPSGEGISTIGEMAGRVDNPIIIEGFRYDRLAEALVVMGQRKNVCIESHLINSPNFVELLKAEGFLDRLIFGSNAPLAYIGAAVAPIEAAQVSDEEKKKIFGGNIGRILGIER